MLTTLPIKIFVQETTHEISHTNISNRPRGVHETRTAGTDAQFTENMKDDGESRRNLST